MAVVSLVADSFQWFKSTHGVDITETPREVSFCGYTILQDQVFVVEDTHADPRFANNPMVAGEPNVRFYAGYPIRAENGSRVGALCVFDRAPRTLSADDREALRDLAAFVETELQNGQMGETQKELLKERDALKRRASLDAITHIWNREAILELLRGELSRARRGSSMCVAVVEVDNFRRIQEAYGEAVGDTVLVEIAGRARRTMREYDAIGRFEEQQFLIVLGGCGVDVAQSVCERIRRAALEAPVQTDAQGVYVTVSVGLAAYRPQMDGLPSILEAAGMALANAQEMGRNRVELSGRA